MKRIGIVVCTSVAGLLLAGWAPSAGAQGRVEGIVIPVATGEPFSAKLMAEWTDKLPDGTTVRKTFFNLLARDSEGRVHQERRTMIPAGSEQASKVTAITIWDAPQRTRITCEVAERICQMNWFMPRVQLVDEPEGLSRDGKSFLTREKLGTEMRGELAVEHSRETRATNAGAEGNSKPLSTTKEFWYSPDLKINLAIRRNCACGAVEDLQVTDLQRTEPDVAMFQPPEGYTIVDLRQGPGPQVR